MIKIGCERHGGNWYGVELELREPPEASLITVWHGSSRGPGSTGATLSPEEILEVPYFVSYLERSGSCWFLPLVEKLAGGGRVGVEEIAAARKHR